MDTTSHTTMASSAVLTRLDQLTQLVDHFHKNVSDIKTQIEQVTVRVQELEKASKRHSIQITNEAPSGSSSEPAKKKSRSTGFAAKLKKDTQMRKVAKKKAETVLAQDMESPLIKVIGNDVYKKISTNPADA